MQIDIQARTYISIRKGKEYQNLSYIYIDTHTHISNGNDLMVLFNWSWPRFRPPIKENLFIKRGHSVDQNRQVFFIKAF